MCLFFSSSFSRNARIGKRSFKLAFVFLLNKAKYEKERHEELEHEK
jgi:hypothetical protein